MQTLEFVWIRDNCASLVLKKKISQMNFDLENFVSILAYKIVPASNISRYLLFIILKFFIFALFFLEKSHWIKVHSNRTPSIEHLKMKISANKFFTNQFESDHFFEKKKVYIFLAIFIELIAYERKKELECTTKRRRSTSMT